MMEKDKNKIDEIFREGLDNANFDFNESDWEKMESRLNNDRNKRKSTLYFLTALSIAAAAVLTLFFIWNEDAWVESKKMDNASQSTVVNRSEQQVGDTIIQHDFSHITPQGKTENIKSGLKSDVDFGLVEKTGEELIQNNALAAFPEANNGILSRIETKTDFTVPKMKFKAGQLPRFNLSVDPVETTGDRLAALYNQKRIEEPSAAKREPSVLTLLAGPDLTSVKGAGKSSLSQNVGLAYSYPLTKGLSVSVGAIYAKKNYKSAYSFYAPSNPPQMTQLPSQVSAVCDVIDVPLTANYAVLKNKRIKFNVSAGLSSYFMLKEKYTFDYEAESSYGGKKGAVYEPKGSYGDKKSVTYEVKGENQHIFGVADFSISVEKKISDKVNIGVKPFIKIPLTGIGYGNVNLQSKGVAVTLGLSL
ncbi:outer membrane beta-barrel protein [Sphingobacterium sp. CZ-UAM]|uniref:outer membrane beta-barrel protein n=1 Tax=Sphingobacterium sp. CZ-UAM TaxID=1933868 RepID=UPI0009873BA5|nr:outer membrane beta-barrel protein [Sphingobacterium sp. CZ-UAM]